MAVATTPLGMAEHWDFILDTYENKECTHTKHNKTLDASGHVIDETETDYTIYGAISPIHNDVVIKSAGLFQFGDLTAYFLITDDVEVGEAVSETETRYDTITYNGVVYTVNQKTHTATDDGVDIISKYILRKIAA